MTDPARYRTRDGRPAVGVFFNGFYGTAARRPGAAATLSGAVPLAVPSGKSGVMTVSNINVVPMDIAGGRGGLHAPRTLGSLAAAVEGRIQGAQEEED